MKKVIAALALGAVALATAPVLTSAGDRDQSQGGRGFSVGHRGAGTLRGFGHLRDFRREHHRNRVFINAVPLFVWTTVHTYHPPAPVDPPPQAYWYWCQSAGVYYPYVASCPEGWLPVPATAP
jgi:hypothetical protein